MSNKLVTLLGPTASGKTDLAIALAKKHHGQIICADSRTIYRGMDIGTAKPTAADRRVVEHHLLDIVEPNQSFSARDFKIIAQKAMSDIWQAGQIPFLVGGSGMYIDAVLFDYKFRHPRLHPDIRLDDCTLAELVEKAKRKYPEEIKKIDIKNRRRVEQLILKGPSKNDDRKELKIDTLIIGLSPNKAYLKEKIDLRTKEMLNKGFVQEVEKLRQLYGRETIALQTTGYSAVNQFLDGKIDQAEMQNQISKQTMELAKKQMTWFARNKYIKWVKTPAAAEELVNNYLENV